ncbi:MAG: HAD family hydrolase [Deltaproteobacteria bacterium]|nr:HAD family hydrolase [Deltaproteobacteria bacterium]
MTPDPIKAVIFDCDGVMFDTTAANSAYYNRILKHLGRPQLTPEQFAYCHMHTVGNALRYLFADAGQLEAALAFRREMGYRDFIPMMTLEPHLKPLLRQLRPRIKTAVGTNRSDTMDAVMEVHGLTSGFDLVVTASDVPAPKPAPDILNHVLTTFQLNPAETIYIGDSEVDEMAADAAGIPLVAYRNRALQAWRHIDSLDEISGLLNIAGAA